MTRREELDLQIGRDLGKPVNPLFKSKVLINN
jgi:hypothetical protein